MAHPTQVQPTLTLAELRGALAAACPAAILVPTWVLREFIVHDRTRGRGWFVPRQRTYVIDRERALALASQERLPIEGMPSGPEWLALLPEPDSDWLASTPTPQVLRHYWRLLFRSRISAEVRGQPRLRKTPPLVNTRAGLLRHFGPLGHAQVHEIRQVLQQERLLAAGADDAEVLAEFVAVFLELFYFHHPMLSRFFPLIADATPVLEWLGQSIDADGLWRQTRLAGAADAPAAEPAHAVQDEIAKRGPALSGSPDGEDSVDRGPSRSASRRNQEELLAAAGRAAARGNDVRAAVLHTQAFLLGGTLAGVNHGVGDLDALAERLASVAEIGTATATEWRRVLRPLLRLSPAGGGTTTPGCSTTCRKSASTTNARSIPSTLWNGRWTWPVQWAQGRAESRCAGLCLDNVSY